MKIKNYTPHKINILQNNSIVEYPSLGTARCSVSKEYLFSIDEIEVYNMKYGQVIGLPDVEEDTIFIVSKIVAEALKDQRDDLLIVNEVVKDENNVVLYCKSLSKL